MRAVFFGLFEEIAQHAHVQRLSETPWPGEKIHLSAQIDQVFYQQCLIDIVIAFFYDFFKVFHSDRKRGPFHINLHSGA